MLLINRLAKVEDDPIVQGADPVNIVGIARPPIDEVR
jgi:hypothetical protein